MRHDLDEITENYKLDKAEFTEFALKPENYDKYGIVKSENYVTTSTWFCDLLIEDFKKYRDEKEKSN